MKIKDTKKGCARACPYQKQKLVKSYFYTRNSRPFRYRNYMFNVSLGRDRARILELEIKSSYTSILSKSIDN